MEIYDVKEEFEWICDLHSIGEVAREEIWDFIMKVVEDAYR